MRIYIAKLIKGGEISMFFEQKYQRQNAVEVKILVKCLAVCRKKCYFVPLFAISDKK